MSYVPVIKAKKLIPILARMGFKMIRQKGSHAHLEHVLDRTRKITVPIHNKDLARRTLISILKQGRISLKELIEVIKR